MESTKPNGAAYCLKCVPKYGRPNTVARAGVKCKYGSQSSHFSIQLKGHDLQQRMCWGRILYCGLVCGNCAYTDPLGSNRPKGSLHYTTPTQVTRINDEGQEVDFYIHEYKESFKNLGKSLEQNKNLSEVKCDLISDNKKLTKVNCDLVPYNNKLTGVNCDLVSDNNK